MKNITLLFFFFLLVLLSCSNTPQEDDMLIIIQPTTDEVEDSLTVGEKEEESSVKLVIDSIVYKFSQVAAGDLQGADCYDGVMFQFCDMFSYASCYDMETYKRLSLFKTPSVSSYHCNNADFSNIFYDENDRFPLLYISQFRDNDRCVIVCRIIQEGMKFTIRVVQKIQLPMDHSIIGYYTDAVLDNENGFMYVYSYNSTKYNSISLHKFKMPEFREDETVVLTNDDIIESFNNGYCKHPQGAKIKDGLLYMVEGVPNWGTEVYLRVTNLENKSHARVSFSKMQTEKIWEPEDIFFYNDELYCASNFCKGVYKMSIRFENLE
jgi:hypothetical protein